MISQIQNSKMLKIKNRLKYNNNIKKVKINNKNKMNNYK